MWILNNIKLIIGGIISFIAGFFVIREMNEKDELRAKVKKEETKNSSLEATIEKMDNELKQKNEIMEMKNEFAAVDRKADYIYSEKAKKINKEIDNMKDGDVIKETI